MPRNGNGQYNLPEAAFVSGTVISSTAVNSDFSDIADALTNSLARDSQGGMLDTLLLDPTGFVYTNDPNTGVHRAGADAQAIKCGGTDVIDITTSGADVTGDFDVSGSITQRGAPLMPVGSLLPYAGSAAPTGWLLCYGQAISRTTYADLYDAIGTAYGVGDGSSTFNVPDLRGRIPAGRDNMGGSAANRLTSTTMTPDGNTLGATGGVQSGTIAQSNLPNVNFTVTIPSGQGSHTHGFTACEQSGAHSGVGSGSNNQYSVSEGGVQPATLPSMTGTAASGGSGDAFVIVQPTTITNYIIFAGV